MSDLKLKAEERKVKGRKVKALRREVVLPANVFGKGIKSQTIKDDLILGKKKLPVLISNTQVDPVTDNPIHVDFYQVNLKEKVTASIPVELLGEAPAEKQGLGTLVQHVNEIEIEALPTDLPEKFEVDVTRLKDVDDQIEVKDLKVNDKKIDISDEEKEKIIVKVEPLRKEEEVAPPVTEEVPEGEEGEASVEGEEAKGEAGEKAPETGEQKAPETNKEAPKK